MTSKQHGTDSQADRQRSTDRQRSGVDHETYREWVDRDLAGALGRAERARLEAHLEDCGPCCAERADLRAMDQLLHAGRVAVREDFRDGVMASLPVAPWEARAPKAWRLPVAALVALLMGAGALLGLSSDSLGGGGSALGTFGAVAELFAAGALAGAGLLGASWQGVGLVTLETLGRVPGGLLVFVVLVVCLNLLLIQMLRRPARVESPGTVGAGRSAAPLPRGADAER